MFACKELSTAPGHCQAGPTGLSSVAVQEAPIEETPRCRHCGDVIGAYEPMVLVTDGLAYRTSRAALGAGARVGHNYHSACYMQAGGEPALDG